MRHLALIARNIRRTLAWLPTGEIHQTDAGAAREQEFL